MRLIVVALLLSAVAGCSGSSSAFSKTTPAPTNAELDAKIKADIQRNQAEKKE